MEKNCFISGYTGFCPDMAHRIGQNFTDCTKDAIREQPHMLGRLGAMRWQEMQKSGVALRSGDGFEYAYNAMPDYASGYTGHVPTDLWTSCKKDSQSYDAARCPLKAIPLSCSEFGSPCLDNRCHDEYSVCNTQDFGPEANIYVNVPHGDYRPNQYHEDSKSSKSCCSSCSEGGSCKSEQRNTYKLFKPVLKACCNSCAQGGTCESDRKNPYDSTKQSSRASYSSCSSGGSHENSRTYDSSGTSYCRFKYPQRKMAAYRKCGVIPNYMGYIPGLHMTFGEPYGITANRLLRRHFKEQENRHF